VLFPADADEEFDATFGTGIHRLTGPRAPEQPTVLVNAPNDPAMRPDADSEAWSVQVAVPRHVAAGADDPAAGRLLGRPRGIDWAAPGFADAYADRLLAVMAERGLDVRDRVIWRELRTPADVEWRTRSVGGSLHGPSNNTNRSTFVRPANRSPVPGLFLVGGSTHPGGGLPQVGMSAQIVAGLIGRA
jgi:phytoene dehydrogenase-like protein